MNRWNVILEKKSRSSATYEKFCLNHHIQLLLFNSPLAPPPPLPVKRDYFRPDEDNKSTWGLIRFCSGGKYYLLSESAPCCFRKKGKGGDKLAASSHWHFDQTYQLYQLSHTAAAVTVVWKTVDPHVVLPYLPLVGDVLTSLAILHPEAIIQWKIIPWH